MDVTNKADLKRLKAAIHYSREQHEVFRKNRKDAIEQFTGQHYGNGKEQVPVNYIELATSIYTHRLVGGPPRAYTATNDRKLKAAAFDLKAALDKTAERMDLEETLLEAVQDGMFTDSVVKIGLTEAGGEAWWGEVGQPYCVWIDPDDWVYDVNAKSWRELSYAGNRYIVPLSRLKEADGYDQAEVAKIRPKTPQETNETGDQKARALSGGFGEEGQYEDEVELWDIWLPRTKQVVTLCLDGEDVGPLRVVKWKGPPQGPYIRLSFVRVPSQLMGLPPVAIWRDLHDLANDLHIKLGRQAVSQKSILPFRGGNQDDIDRVNETKDGGTVRIDGEYPVELSLGGPHSGNLLYSSGLEGIIDRHFGGLNTLGGLGTSADTLGQEEMLAGNASQRLVFMRRRVAKFVGKIFRGLAHYLYKDPYVSLPLKKRIPGTNRDRSFLWDAKNRQGDPSLFDIAIEPESLQPRSSEGQLAKLLEVIRDVIMPIAPEMLQQNIESLLRIIADKGNLPELAELFLHFQPSESQGEGDGPRKPSVTTRRYERKGRPGAGSNQAQTALMQAASAMQKTR